MNASRSTPIAPARAGAIGVFALVAIAALSGCSPAPLTRLPEGITVAIQQNRDDYGPRRLELVVTNDGSEPVTVTRAVFTSPGFVSAASWDRPAEIVAGTTTNLRVQLPEADCDGAASAGAGLGGSVLLDFTRPDGRTGSASVTPDDPFDAITAVTTQDCAAESVAEIATIGLADTLRTVKRDGELVALLDLTVTPTGDPRDLVVESVSDTILVRSASSDGWAVHKRLTAASAPLVVTLDFVPNNCRLHTVAEDKRGTYFPVTVRVAPGTADAANLTFPVAASTAVKQQVYAYIADYCGWD